jgi:hypothetical protein
VASAVAIETGAGDRVIFCWRISATLFSVQFTDGLLSPGLFSAALFFCFRFVAFTFRGRIDDGMKARKPSSDARLGMENILQKP